MAAEHDYNQYTIALMYWFVLDGGMDAEAERTLR